MPSHSESNSLQRAAAAALNAVGKHVDLEKLALGDAVYIQMTEAVAIEVVKPR